MVLRHSISTLFPYTTLFRSYEALIDADCLAVLTEWPEFKIPNFNIISKLLNSPVVFDGRNIYDKSEMFKNGFDYFCIGINTSKLALKPELSQAV